MTSIWLIFLIGLLIANTFLYYCLTRINLPFASFNLDVQRESLTSDKFGNLLIVTAHPDDEIMFFGPSIVNWLKYTGRKVFIICLSSGDADGIGETRKKELYKCCEFLGIPKKNVQLVEHEELKDGMNNLWPNKAINDIVEPFIIKNKIRTIFTFDTRGVSGHINHIACRVALGRLIANSPALMKLDKIPAIYSLTTVSLFRKYSSLMDLIFSLGEVKFDSLSLLRHPNIQYSKVPKSLLFLNNFGDWLKCRKAMKLHDSQMVWFRHLYILFSRYMFINNLQLVEPEA